MKDLRMSFVGRIISCYTHEVKNYLAIIKETNGLMKDVIEIKKSKALDEKHFLGFIGCVDEQVGRATAITDYLSRFAHRMDADQVVVHINDLIDELVALMSRLAYRNRISFNKQLRGGLPSTMLNPMHFHYFLFCLIEAKMLSLDRNGVISISTHFADGCFCITLGSEGGIVPSSGIAETSNAGEIEGIAMELGAVIINNGCETVIKMPAVTKVK
jgi:C4-dicarboxylate-specific signal transduction histidine kinase